MADRIGVISKGEIILVEEKAALMQKLGKKRLTVQLQAPMTHIPPQLENPQLQLSADGYELQYTFDSQGSRTGIAGLLRQLAEQGIDFKDLQTSESSLEEIFVSLVSSK
jgi:ABC-2 type transport system ATP-binding protein